MELEERIVKYLSNGKEWKLYGTSIHFFITSVRPTPDRKLLCLTIELGGRIYPGVQGPDLEELFLNYFKTFLGTYFSYTKKLKVDILTNRRIISQAPVYYRHRISSPF
jgi:hypothetical protein